MGCRHDLYREHTLRNVRLSIWWHVPLVCPNTAVQQMVQSPSGKTVCYFKGPVWALTRSVNGLFLYSTTTAAPDSRAGTADSPLRRSALAFVDSLS